MTDAAFTALTTARLALRRFRAEDLDAFAAYRSDPEVARYQSWEVPYELGQARQFLEELEAIHPDTPGEWFQFAVTLRGTDRLIGDCAAHVDADDPRQAEIGFTLPPSTRGTAMPPRRPAGCSTTCLSSVASTGSARPATLATRAQPPCWNGWACAERATRWRAPGPRASGPATCTTPSWPGNGPPAAEGSLAVAPNRWRERGPHAPRRATHASSPISGR
jgi:hypothetical protein